MSNPPLYIFKIDPVAKPRQTTKDRFNPSLAVIRYRNFADHLRALAKNVRYSPGHELSLTFVIKMPDSWSKKKKAEMKGKPHQQTPDLDNLIKAFKDALFKVKAEDDCVVWKYGRMTKVWGEEGAINVFI